MKAFSYSTAHSLHIIINILKIALDSLEKVENQMVQSQSMSYGIALGAVHFRKEYDR